MVPTGLQFGSLGEAGLMIPIHRIVLLGFQLAKFGIMSHFPGLGVGVAACRMDVGWWGSWDDVFRDFSVMKSSEVGIQDGYGVAIAVYSAKLVCAALEYGACV